MKTHAVVGRGKKSLLYDPGSELRLGGRRRKKGEGYHCDEPKSNETENEFVHIVQTFISGTWCTWYTFSRRSMGDMFFKYTITNFNATYPVASRGEHVGFGVDNSNCYGVMWTGI